jgi:molybdenum cofactor biosynthesis enzyme
MATKVTTSLSLHQSTIVEMEPMLAMSRYALQLFDALDYLAVDQIAPHMEAHGKEL